MTETLALAIPPSEYFRNTSHQLDPALLAGRLILASIYDAAIAYSDPRYRLPSTTVAATINEVGMVPGVEMLESTVNFAADEDYRCVEYAFGVVKRESWALGGYTLKTTPELWDNPATFLVEHGYRPTLDPTVGDVVFYGGVDETVGKLWLGHVGIFDGLDDSGTMRVVSKLAKGPVIRHNIHLIPSHRFAGWGDAYWFLHKHEA